MGLSVQQQAVIDFTTTGQGNVNVIARAGCGKSYTLLEAVQAIKTVQPLAEVAMVAFNRSIATELQAKILPFGWGVSVQAATMNSVGNRAIGAYLDRMKGIKKLDVDAFKVKKLVDLMRDEAMKASGQFGQAGEAAAQKAEMLSEQAGFVVKAVGLAKQRAFGVVHPSDQITKWMELIEHFGLDQDWDENEMMISEGLIRLCIEVYNRSLDLVLLGKLDYDDQILAPLFFKCKIWPKQFVLVDEAQDLNPARRLLAIRMAGTEGRIIAVGDPAQAIYGFTGADSDSMDLLKAAVNSTELPLNLTYRCPKAVVQVAQQWVPDFQAHESNPEGLVRSIELNTVANVEDGSKVADFSDEKLDNTMAILCRNTKPLVELAWTLIRRSVACRVEGRDIGQGLIQMANRWKVKTLSAFVNRVNGWAEKETAKLKTKDREDLIQSVQDKADTIVCICEGLIGQGKTTVVDFETFVNNLFGDTKDGEIQKVLTLSTVHKAKGREWNRVYILGANKYMPSRYAKKPWEIQAEQNIQYVAVTRAKEELVFINV